MFYVIIKQNGSVYRWGQKYRFLKFGPNIRRGFQLNRQAVKPNEGGLLVISTPKNFVAKIYLLTSCQNKFTKNHWMDRNCCRRNSGQKLGVHFIFGGGIFFVGRVRTLDNTVWQKYFVKYSVVYHDHKLIILKMTENNSFEGLVPSFYMDFSYFYPHQFQTFPGVFPCQGENMPYCQFYPIWDQPIQIEEHSEPAFDKADENHVVEQTSTGSRSMENFEKVKRTQAPRFRPTKNNESNISNQSFSFATNENKSKNILESFFKNKRKVELYYEYSKCLNSKRKKYMSKGTLLKLCTLTQKSPELEQVLKSKNFSNITLGQFASGVRFLILYFLKHKSTSSILTSQKIALNLKKDHINKVREILNHLEENIQIERDRLPAISSAFTVKLEF